MVKCVDYIRWENPPADFSWKGPENISLTAVIRNALETETPLLLRSLVVAVLCRLRLTAGHTVMKLGSPVSTRKTRFQSCRGRWQHLIVRDNIHVITVIGSMVEMVSRVP